MLAKEWLILVVIALASILFFMLFDVGSHWGIILKLRGTRLLSLVVVGVAMGISTLLLQTLTQNPILTPGILGFDALFVLMQIVLVFIYGGYGYIGLNIYLKFMIEALLMLSAAVLLFSLLFKQNDLAKVLLVGIIMGVLFRSGSAFLQRMIDPNDFLILQSALFARFNIVNKELLGLATFITMLTLIFIWRLRFVLDIIMLGREQAVNLGVPYVRYRYLLLVLITMLVVVSTALVGPVSFFGLLICALANQIVRQQSHSVRIPVIILLSVILLVSGQALFEHVLHMKSTLSVVLDAVGGVIFLLMLSRQKVRTV